MLIITNLFPQITKFVLPADLTVESTELLISNYEVDNGDEIKEITLSPYEARVYRLN